MHVKSTRYRPTI